MSSRLVCYHFEMAANIRRKVAALVSTLIFAYIFFEVLDRLHIVLWVQVPWWGLILLGVLVFVAIDYFVNRIFNT